MRLPSVKTIPGYTSYGGGIDMVTPPILITPNMAISATNYIASKLGGFARVDGYERFDGRPSPSAQKYYWCLVDLTGDLSVGDTITGTVSNATGIVLSIFEDHINIFKTTGTWKVESFTVGGAVVGEILSLPIKGGELRSDVHAQILSDTADEYRKDINKVPGDGPIRGVVYFSGKVYAFRDDGTASKMYESTGTGWTEVTTPERVAGGKFEFAIYNFTGSTDTRCLYGCDGKNKAFEFDGTTFTEITTGMAADTPQHIAAWKNYLCLSFLGSLQMSDIGDPKAWTGLAGATEISMGDDITALLVQPGDSLAVFGRNSTFHLEGTSPEDFTMKTIAYDVGCVEWTAQNLGSAFALDDRGIIRIKPTDAYGNFSQNTISQVIQPLINTYKNNIVASTTYRSEDQYRLYCNDGTGIVLTLSGNNYFYSQFKYPTAMSCVFSGEDSSGESIVFMGGSDGYVYQADRGSSFDGAEIEAILRPSYNSFKSPSVHKRYRNAFLEMNANGFCQIFAWAEYDYSDANVDRQPTLQIDTLGGGGFWDVNNWESFRYDTKVYSTPNIRLDGTGVNIGVVFYSRSKIDLGHKIDGLTINYTPLRIRI